MRLPISKMVEIITDDQQSKGFTLVQGDKPPETKAVERIIGLSNENRNGKDGEADIYSFETHNINDARKVYAELNEEFNGDALDTWSMKFEHIDETKPIYVFVRIHNF
jgi:hypothetical protein